MELLGLESFRETDDQLSCSRSRVGASCEPKSKRCPSCVMSQRTLGHEAHTKSVGFAPANPYGVHMKVSFIDIPRRSRLQLSPVVTLVQRPTKLPQIRAYLGSLELIAKV